MRRWDDLDAELDLWAKEEMVATFWWRDDDAIADSDDLRQLLALSLSRDVPLGLAVVPFGATESLVAAVHSLKTVRVLQHGYAHRNFAPPDAKKIELGPERPTDIVIGELATGLDQLSSMFGDQALPVLVPPWNRIATHLVPMLPEMGYTALSAYGPRERARPVAGLSQINTHVDVIDWKGGRGFVGEDIALSLIVDHLSDRRTGRADPNEPTGILSHHQVHDQPTWQFLDALFDKLRTQSSTEILAADELTSLPSNPAAGS